MSRIDKDATTLAGGPTTPRGRPHESRRAISDERLQEGLGERYVDLEPIGKGGMGEVYRAYDRELAREVALKVVRTDLAEGSLALVRFRREVQLSSTITHTNVLRVYDLNEVLGIRFLSMQYVEGDDLASLLARAHPMPFERVVSLFRQACEGLSAAHEKGVVHRDLKPQNILVDLEDHVYVADWGLAKALEDPTMTAEGSLFGSPMYMSPEHVRGEPIGVRSDVYSLGVILYELLSGQPPFKGDTLRATMEQRLHRKPAPLEALRPDVPRYLERVVSRCLSLAPARRYASVPELLADLDKGQASARAPGTGRAGKALAVAAATAVIVVTVWTGWLVGRHRGAARPVEPTQAQLSDPEAAARLAARPQVLVLGFENRTDDPLLDGTVDVIFESALERSTLVDPVAGPALRNLAATLGGGSEGQVGIDERMGRLLTARDGCRVVTVRGWIASKGAGYRIALTATDAKTLAPLLSREVDASEPARVVTVLSRLGGELRAALGDASASPAGADDGTDLSASLEADHEFTLGRALANSGPKQGSITHLERAVAIDPEFARAHARLGLVYWDMLRRADAEKHFKLALGGQGRMAERQRLKFLGDYYSLVGDSARGVASYEEALEKYPRDLYTATNLAETLVAQRQMKRALELARVIAAKDPKDLNSRENLAFYCIYVNDFDGAAREATTLTREFARPTYDAYLVLAIADIARGRRAEALDAYEKERAADPSFGAVSLADLAIAEGRLSDAIGLLEKGVTADLEAKNEEAAALKNAMLAEVHLRRGDKAEAVAAAERVVGSGAVLSTLYQAAEVLIIEGQEKKGLVIAAGLEQATAQDPRMLGKLLRGEAMRLHGDPAGAIAVFKEARGVVDGWLVHVALGKAYVDLGSFEEARAEFEICLARWGEGARSSISCRRSATCRPSSTSSRAPRRVSIARTPRSRTRPSSRSSRTPTATC